MCGLSGSTHNNSVFQFSSNGELNRGASIRALEFMAANWLKVQSSQPSPTPDLLSHSHQQWQTHCEAIAPWSVATPSSHASKIILSKTLSSLTKLFPDCAHESIGWNWEKTVLVSCMFFITGRKRVLRKTCHTWRAMEQQKPHNEKNSEHQRVRTNNLSNEMKTKWGCAITGVFLWF